jgi:hypothetical protein
MKIETAIHKLAQAFLRSLVVLRAMFQEIFEESAYARFLDRQGVASSRETYARFLRENETARLRRPRCC